MKTSDKILKWTPRILCIIAILFISLFALDSFSPERTLLQNLGAFLMHLIPSFILLAILLVAWKWANIGGIILLVAGIIFSILVFNLNYSRNHFSLMQSIINATIICLPFIIAGILFMVSHGRDKKGSPVV